MHRDFAVIVVCIPVSTAQTGWLCTVSFPSSIKSIEGNRECGQPQSRPHNYDGINMRLHHRLEGGEGHGVVTRELLENY